MVKRVVRRGRFARPTSVVDSPTIVLESVQAPDRIPEVNHLSKLRNVCVRFEDSRIPCTMSRSAAPELKPARSGTLGAIHRAHETSMEVRNPSTGPFGPVMRDDHDVGRTAVGRHVVPTWPRRIGASRGAQNRGQSRRRRARGCVGRRVPLRRARTGSLDWSRGGGRRRRSGKPRLVRGHDVSGPGALRRRWLRDVHVSRVLAFSFW